MSFCIKYSQGNQLIVASNLAAQPHLNADRSWEQLLYCYLLLPEQGSIVQHLERLNTDIDAAGVSRARRQIELMEEYRTRLIADVVTGKIDVREAANTT